jgi:hypothetical protein
MVRVFLIKQSQGRERVDQVRGIGAALRVYPLNLLDDLPLPFIVCDRLEHGLRETGVGRGDNGEHENSCG